jgi:hypothetical protein
MEGGGDAYLHAENNHAHKAVPAAKVRLLKASMKPGRFTKLERFYF